MKLECCRHTGLTELLLLLDKGNIFPRLPSPPINVRKVHLLQLLEVQGKCALEEGNEAIYLSNKIVLTPQMACQGSENSISF